MIFDVNNLILNTNDYNFTLLAHQGFGGKTKYIATPNKDGLPKLLVKHKGEFAPPCNSFVYSRMAELLSINAPKAYMMNVAEKDKRLFESNCVVGIEFIEGLQPIKIDEIKDNEKLKKQFIHCFLLAGLFTQFEDSMQCAYLPEEAVIPLDFDDSFGLENPAFNSIIKENQMSELLVKHHLECTKRHNLDIYLKICIEMAAEQLDISTSEVQKEFLTVLQRFCDLTNEEISSVTNTLLEFFSPLLAVYYEEYIYILQAKAMLYIKNI